MPATSQTGARLSESDWEQRLGAALACEARVRYSRARRYVLRVHDLCRAPGALRRPAGRGVLVRMNAFFAEAPEEIAEALVLWVRSGSRARRASRALDLWIQGQVGALECRAPRAVRATPHGAAHDLGPLALEIWREHFAGDFASAERLPTITWGRRGKSQSRHSLQLGIYDYHARVVRLHRVLDQPAVPEWFVRYVLFHELLHAALHEASGGAAPQAGGCARPSAQGAEWRVHHGPEFRAREQAYPHYHRALLWERANLAALIRSARNGRPLRSALRLAEPAGPRAALAGAIERWRQAALF